MLKLLRPRLAADERLIWQRDPLAFTEVTPQALWYRFMMGLGAILMLASAFVITPFDDLWGVHAALAVIWGAIAALPSQTRWKGGRYPHTLTSQRLILSPLRSLPLGEITRTEPRGRRVMVKARGAFHEFGPVEDPTEVINAIEEARAHA